MMKISYSKKFTQCEMRTILLLNRFLLNLFHNIARYTFYKALLDKFFLYEQLGYLSIWYSGLGVLIEGNVFAETEVQPFEFNILFYCYTERKLFLKI